MPPDSNSVDRSSKHLDFEVFHKSPDSSQLENVGRIRVIGLSDLKVLSTREPWGDALRSAVDRIQKAEFLELDIEENIVNDEGDEVLVYKTARVRRGDPRFPYAVRQELRSGHEFRTKEVKLLGDR